MSSKQKIWTTTNLAVLFYFILTAIGLIWTYLRDGELFWAGYVHTSGFQSIVLGAACAFVVVVLSRWAIQNTNWAKQLELSFRRILGPLSGSDIILLASVSGVSEEIFFRGAMQPSLGIIITSVLFGLLHTGPNKSFLPWTLFALVMGFVLGLLAHFTQSLVAPIICHSLINGLNLHFMAQVPLQEEDS